MFRIVICDEKKESSDKLVVCINRLIKELAFGNESEFFKAKTEMLFNYKIRDVYT